MTFKSLAAIAAAFVVGLAVAVHFFAPELMRALGQAIHGGR